MTYANDRRVNATVTDVQLGNTSTGKVQLGISFQLEDQVPGYSYSTITGFLFFTDNTMQITEDALRNLGWDPTKHAWGIDDMIRDRALVGAEASLVIAPETYEGKERWKVKFINARGGGGMKNTMDDAGASAFVAQLRSRLGVAPPARKRPAPVPQRQPSPNDWVDSDPGLALDADDVPF